MCCAALLLHLLVPYILQDWQVVRDVVEHEWRHASLYNTASPQAGQKRFLKPRFIQGCSFNFMQPAGAAATGHAPPPTHARAVCIHNSQGPGSWSCRQHVSVSSWRSL